MVSHTDSGRFRVLRRMSGPYNMNTYFLSCQDTGEALVIDPGGKADELAWVLAQENLSPLRILLTHGHADQFFSMDGFRAFHDIPYCLHGADDLFFKDPKVREQTFRSVGLPPPSLADITLAHQDEIRFGSCLLRVLHTPGHTPGSSCFLCGDHLFTGDTLFVGEAGRTDLPGGELPRLIDSIRDRLLPLPDDTVLLPGHHHTGMPVQSTLAREKRENIYITDFITDP